MMRSEGGEVKIQDRRTRNTGEDLGPEADRISMTLTPDTLTAEGMAMGIIIGSVLEEITRMEVVGT
jgi:hypothetical protein